MLDAIVAATFEDVAEADQVGLDVSMRIFQRVAHAGLRGQVDHTLEVAFGEQVFHGHAVGDIALHEAEIRVGLKLRQPREFNAGS